MALVSRTESELERTAEMAGGETLVAAADVSDALQVSAAVEMALRKFGGVRLLVNNAGLAPVRSVEAMSIEEWHATIDTNLSAVFYFCRALWPHWRAAGEGVVVNVSSAASRDPFAGFGCIRWRRGRRRRRCFAGSRRRRSIRGPRRWNLRRLRAS